MAKHRNQWEAEARAMADRIDRQRAMGEQMTFLPDEGPAGQAGTEVEAGSGRPKGAKNKASTQLRDWLAAKGLRMPEDVLTEIAGLRSREDAITLAMARAERILSWSFEGAHIGDGAAPRATSAMRLHTFTQQYTIILRALEAIMPYTAAKATPDVAVTQNTTVIVPAQPAPSAHPGDLARDVTPPKRGRMMPADVAHEIEQNQALSEASRDVSDVKGRTE